MTERMSTFFPSEFTGIAQWIICTIYILSCPMKKVFGAGRLWR